MKLRRRLLAFGCRARFFSTALALDEGVEEAHKIFEDLAGIFLGQRTIGSALKYGAGLSN